MRLSPGTFKVDFAIQDGVPWTHEESRRAGTVHVGGSYSEIADAKAAVARGAMPDKPFVLVCQQHLADPSRSSADVHPLYAYAHVPAGYTGDVTTQIEAQIERFAPGFRERVLAKHVRSVAQMQAHNVNYVGGDVITGCNDARQLVFRPRATLYPYTTGIPGVYLCSAATPPGAGAHGMCGYNAANSPAAPERSRSRWGGGPCYVARSTTVTPTGVRSRAGCEQERAARRSPRGVRGRHTGHGLSVPSEILRSLPRRLVPSGRRAARRRAAATPPRMWRFRGR